MQESFTGLIDLPEDDPETFEKFTQFIYSGGYVDGLIQQEGSSVCRVMPASLLTDEEAEDELRQPGQRNDWDLDGVGDYVRGFPESYEDDLGVAVDVIQCASMKDECAPAALLAARVYAMADKFLVPRLKVLALDRVSLYFDKARRLVDEDGVWIKACSDMYDIALATDLMLQEVCVCYVYDRFQEMNLGAGVLLSKISGALSTGLGHYHVLKSFHDDKELVEIGDLWAKRMRGVEE